MLELSFAFDKFSNFLELGGAIDAVFISFVDCVQSFHKIDKIKR